MTRTDDLIRPMSKKMFRADAKLANSSALPAVSRCQATPRCSAAFTRTWRTLKKRRRFSEEALSCSCSLSEHYWHSASLVTRTRQSSSSLEVQQELKYVTHLSTQVHSIQRLPPSERPSISSAIAAIVNSHHHARRGRKHAQPTSAECRPATGLGVGELRLANDRTPQH
jgi:hypothetical protein